MEINKNVLLWVIIGVLFLVVLFLIFKISGLTGKASSGEIDMTGWTENEKMNYEMHGTIPSGVQRSASRTSSGSDMVGGC